MFRARERARRRERRGGHAPSAASNCASLLVTSVPVNSAAVLRPSSRRRRARARRVEPHANERHGALARALRRYARTPTICGKKPRCVPHRGDDGSIATRSGEQSSRARARVVDGPSRELDPPALAQEVLAREPQPVRTLHHSSMSRPSSYGVARRRRLCRRVRVSVRRRRRRVETALVVGRKKFARTRGRAALPTPGHDDGAFSRATAPLLARERRRFLSRHRARPRRGARRPLIRLGILRAPASLGSALRRDGTRTRDRASTRASAPSRARDGVVVRGRDRDVRGWRVRAVAGVSSS